MTIDRQIPAGPGLRLIVDSGATHEHKAVERWLIRNPRFRVHFAPAPASRLNIVERLFSELTQERLRRGVQAILEKVRRGNEIDCTALA